MERKLIKAKGLEFARIGGNEFIVTYFDEKGNTVLTMDPREIFEGESYKLIFGTTLIALTEKINLDLT